MSQQTTENQAHEHDGEEQTISQSAAVKSPSAYNALKSGIYSDNLMPWESESEVENASQRLCQEFDVQGLAGYVLVRQFINTTLQTARLERSQAIIVSGVLNTKAARAEFAEQAGLANISVDKIPDWYFSMEPEDHDRAALHVKCVLQAQHLLDNHSADLMLKVQTTYPELWLKIMGSGSRTRVYTFGEWITKLYGHPKPISNIEALVSQLRSDYRFDIVWYHNEQRFLSILRSIQAKAQINAMTDPNQLRGASMLQRRMQTLLEQLVGLKKLAAIEAEQARPSNTTTKLLQDSAGHKSKPKKVVLDKS